MLVEQIIEFELRGPRPPGLRCTPTTGYFLDKTKISKKNLLAHYYQAYLLLKYSRRQCTLLPLPKRNQLQNLTPKFKILNVF